MILEIINHAVCSQRQSKAQILRMKYGWQRETQVKLLELENSMLR